MDKNSNLKIPNPRPWLANKPSNSSLRGMEIGLPPGRSVHPPEGVATYESKPLPLPPVSVQRYGDSRFSNEVNKAFPTPKDGIGYYETNLNSNNEESRNIDVILGEYQAEKMKQETEIEVKSIPGTPADEVLSLHPKLLVQSKPYRPYLTIPTTAPLSSLPSGHNSAYKIKQLMGVDVSPDDSTICNVMEITPLSPRSITSSSMYSEDLEAGTSEHDTDLYIKLHGDTSSGARTSGTRTTHIGSDTTSWDPWELQSAMDVPFALNLTRPSDKHDFCVTKEVSEFDLPQHPPNNHSFDSHHLRSGPISQRELSLATTTKAQGTFSSVTPPRRNSSPGMIKETMANDPGHLGFESSSVLPRKMASVSHKSYQRHQRTPSTLAIPKMRAPPSHLYFQDDLNHTIPGPRARPSYQPPLTPYPPMRSAFDESDDESDDDNRRSNRVEVSRVARHASTIAKVFKRPEAGGSLFRRSSRPSSASTGEPAAAGADASGTSSRPPTSGSEAGDKKSSTTASTSASATTSATTSTSTGSTRRSLMELSARGGRRISAFAARTSEFARQAAAAGLKSREVRRREVLKAKIRVVEAMGEHCHREEPPQLYSRQQQQQQQQQQLLPQGQHNSLLPPPRPAVRPPPRKDGLSWL